MQLRRTTPAACFRNQLGQANHLLITILIGIEGVRNGVVRKSDDFHAAWNPQDIEQTARRSRRFARDAMMNHVVDALAAYLRGLRGAPFKDALPSLYHFQDRSTKLRLDALASDVGLPESVPLALVHLAIQWRNRRLHSGSDNKVEQKYIALLARDAELITAEYAGLSVSKLLDQFHRTESPRFKEVAALVSASLRLVEEADGRVLARLDPAAVADDVIADALRERVHANRRKAGQQWGNGRAERERKLLALLRGAGFITEAEDPNRPNLSPEYVGEVARLSFREALQRFLSNDEAA